MTLLDILPSLRSGGMASRPHRHRGGWDDAKPVVGLLDGRPEPDLSMLATERMVWAAQKAGDPLLLATMQYVKAAALARIGADAQAVQLTDRTIADVEPLADDEIAAAVLSALHMRRAGLASTAADAYTPDTHFAEARALAARVGDLQVPGTVVGPTNVKFWELGSRWISAVSARP